MSPAMQWTWLSLKTTWLLHLEFLIINVNTNCLRLCYVRAEIVFWHSHFQMLSRSHYYHPSSEQEPSNEHSKRQNWEFRKIDRAHWWTGTEHTHERLTNCYDCKRNFKSQENERAILRTIPRYTRTKHRIRSTILEFQGIKTRPQKPSSLQAYRYII